MKADGAIPFIYASILAPVPDIVADRGGKVDRPFRESGVPIELAAAPERILPMRDYLTLLERAARETGDEHFGVSMSERMAIEDLGAFGRLIISSPTLRQAIETTNALIRMYSSASKCWLEIDGESVRWCYEVTGIHNFREGRRLDCEGSLFLYRSLIRMAAGPDWQPSEILLGRATSHQLRAVQSRLRAPARRCGTYALVFPRSLLDLPMTYAGRLTETQRQALLTRLISTGPGASFIGSVKAIIRGRLTGGYPEMSQVARSTGLSVRTFQRRLAEERIPYSDLVADVRRHLAQEMLADPSRSQLDVAMSLGYSDAANFSRAFKQWTGVAPRDFRRSLERSPAMV